MVGARIRQFYRAATVPPEGVERASTSSDVRLVEVVDPDGEITVCDTCEPQLRSTIVRELDSNRLTPQGGGGQ